MNSRCCFFMIMLSFAFLSLAHGPMGIVCVYNICDGISHPQVTIFIHWAGQQKSWTCKSIFLFGNKVRAATLAKDGAIVVYRAGLVEYAPARLLPIQLTSSKRKQAHALFPLARFHLQHSGRIHPIEPGSRAALLKSVFKKTGFFCPVAHGNVLQILASAVETSSLY